MYGAFETVYRLIELVTYAVTLPTILTDPKGLVRIYLSKWHYYPLRGPETMPGLVL